MAKSTNYDLKARVTPDGKGVTFMHPELMSRIFLPKANEEVDVTITIGKVKRTLAQNRYLWGVAYRVIQQQLQEKFGENMPPEVIHAHNLQIIQGVTLVWKNIGGHDVLIVEDTKTSDMTIDEFSVMVDKLIDWYAINKDIFVPLPEGDNTISEHIKYKQ